MGFAADVANRIIFMENGVIVESGLPSDLLESPQTERLK
jgi:ABC-type histidine transport system ATPase subunit